MPTTDQETDRIPTDASEKSLDTRPNRREARRLAMQLMYQLSLGTDASEEALREHVRGVTPEEEDGLILDSPAVQDEAVKLALAAWAQIEQADEHLNALSPDWPTNRQPAVDRAILRLAYYEITAQRAPVRVAMNEAIELAKTYASENSPSFVNGVLDKLVKKLGISVDTAAITDGQEAPSSDAWLKDAVAE